MKKRLPVKTQLSKTSSISLLRQQLPQRKYDKSAKTPQILHEALQFPSLNSQPTLKISQPNDQCEQEADRIATQVMQTPVPRVQRQMDTGSKLQPVQPTVGHGQAQINTSASFGKPLPKSLRTFYEPRFGADFSQIRIHTESSANIVANSLNARAFTVGQDIFFNQGEFQPATYPGQQLLAHELTHTLQQGTSGGMIMRAPVDSKAAEGKATPKRASTFADIYLAIKAMEFNSFFDGDLARLQASEIKTLGRMVDGQIEFYTNLARQQRDNPKFRPPEGVPEKKIKNVVLEYREFKGNRLEPFVKATERREKAPNLIDPWMKQIESKFGGEAIACAIKNTLDITRQIIDAEVKTNGQVDFTFSNKGILRLGYLGRSEAKDIIDKAVSKDNSSEENRDQILFDMIKKIRKTKTILPLQMARAFLSSGSGEPDDITGLLRKIEVIDKDLKGAIALAQQQSVGATIFTDTSGLPPNAIFNWINDHLTHESENPKSVYSCYRAFMETSEGTF